MGKHITVTISVKSIVATIAILLGLWIASRIPDILTMLVIALILAAALLPGIKHFQEKLKFPRVAAVAANCHMRTVRIGLRRARSMAFDLFAPGKSEKV